MGQWISSKEFAESFNINKKSLEKACFRANQSGKKISSIRSIIINFTYTNGIGGNAGKILQIWNTPLSQKQVEAIEKGYPIKYVLEEMGEVVESANTEKHICSENSSKDAVESRDKTTQPNVMESKDSKALACKENKMEEKGANNEKALKENSREALHTRGHNNASECSCMGSGNPTLYRNDLPNGGVETKENKEREWIALSAKEKAQAKQRERILQDYESAKLSGIAVKHFIELKNREDSTLKLTQGKLFDWQRKYKTQGLSALSDKRGVAKLGTTSLPAWSQEEAIKMGSGYFNRMQLWRELHIIAHLYVEGYSYEKFLKCEIPPLFSFNTLNRFLDSYLKANSLEYTLITYGTDKTDSYKEPAYGMQRDLYTLPNQLWQIDSSPLDAIVLDNDGKQIRPSILSVIDVYSGRNVAYLSETSDSNAVIRLMWKAFESMGKPQAIQFDNGKDYLSNKVQGLLDGLNIVFVRSAAYKGKAKAVVERRFRTIQGSYITAITSYIGRNGNERSAREQQTPKKERKSKDALGNPLKTQG